QRITAKVSCIAWLPSIRLATSITRRNSGMRSSVTTPDGGARLTAGECGAKRLGQVGEAPDQRAGREPDRRPCAEREPKVAGRELAIPEKCRHERQGHAEGRVHERVESDEPK